MKLPEAPHDFTDLARPKVPRVPANARMIRLESVESGVHHSFTPEERADRNRIRLLKYSRTKRKEG
jgi:hypothetical protein